MISVWVEKIEKAFEDEEFKLYLQFIVDNKTGEMYDGMTYMERKTMPAAFGSFYFIFPSSLR